MNEDHAVLDSSAGGIGDPFDAGLATAPTRRVSVERVVDLLNVTHAPETIAAYAAAMRMGQRFPPISVWPLLGRMIVTDGHKRLTACKELGIRRITVELWGCRRLTADLWCQSRAHGAEAVTALVLLFRGPEGRRRARGFVDRTVAHWRRTAVSLLRLLGRG